MVPGLSMPILYKVLTALLALTGCVSLAITGQINLVMSSVALALIPGYYRFFKGEPHASIRIIGLFTFTELLVFLFDSFAVSGDVFIAVAHLTIAFQALKSFDLKEPWDHLQVYFVSLLQLIIASELTSSLAFGVVFVVFMVLLVTAMVVSHFLKEGHGNQGLVRRPVYVISVLTICLTVLFFAGLPRFTYRFISKGHARGIHTTGFSGRMDFGSLGTVKLDPTVVMRVELQGPAAGPLYWRGSTLDYFDGITWKNELRTGTRLRRTADGFILGTPEKGSGTNRQPEGTVKQQTEQQIDLEPLDSDVIFGLARVLSIRTDAYAMTVDAAGTISLPGKTSRRIRYTVISDVADRAAGSADPRYLQVPAGSERISGLALRLVRNIQDEAGRAAFIEGYLRNNYEYSLTVSPPPEGTSPIEDFLFIARKGYCEHYATAMVLMLRGVGIPARVVTGFLGGDRNTYGGYLIVRQSDAHSWVEALIKGQWQRFDPTPPVAVQPAGTYNLFWDSVKMKWSRYVVGYRPEDRSDLLGQFATGLGQAGRLSVQSVRRLMSSGLPAFLLFVALSVLMAVSVLVHLKRRRRGRRKVTAAYLKVRGALVRKGIRITASTTTAEIEAQTVKFPFNPLLREFHRAYSRARFGRGADEEAVLQKARSLIRAMGSKAMSGAGK
ncbi:MAG: hypothetical protein C0402_03310 [Thermodesulfovibrio sp.]|nr:hypothetical protein [Thermodesulfovibrio sp.]